MSAQPVQRPIGFSPSEISALVNENVVSQHAEEAAFLWTMRHRAISEPQFCLKDLRALDGRVEAHLDGLRISGDVGWECSKANLENLGPGEVFALSVLAFQSADRRRMSEALHAGCTSPRTSIGLISALGWLDFDAVSPWIRRLLDARSPAHRAIGIRAAAIHRRDPGDALTSATSDPDPALRAAALRAAGELKRQDLSNHLRSQLRSEDEMCRFWAAWALTLNGERDGLSQLTRWFESTTPLGLRALQVGLRAMSLNQGRHWISALAANPELSQRSVVGAGIVGDPASIPWLIRKMHSPALARLAGEAFTMMTGVDLAYRDLIQDPPPPDEGEDTPIEELLDLNYESNLPWPSPARVDQWWEEHHRAFQAGTRYLAGTPITVQSARKVLSSGRQRQRIAAALELAMLDSDRALFEVRARGDRQQRELSG